MTNPHGTPIWYELLTSDVDAAKAFYDAVVGWDIDSEAGPVGYDYRMIKAGDGMAGGVMRISEEMAAGGAKPRWLFYVGVDDVDATAKQAEAAGARVIVPPTDIPDVGRFAFLFDPQGAPFYIMRGSSDQDSNVFDAMAPDGRVRWNELNTSDSDAALAFYGELFGWESKNSMPMGDMGAYRFLELGGRAIGALMSVPGSPPAWRFYTKVPDIEAAHAAIGANGGTVMHGPSEVPGGDRIVIAMDPQGAEFGLVGPGEGKSA